MRVLLRDNLRNIAYGACFLGGGSLSVALKQIENLDDSFEVELATVAEAAKDRKKLTATLAYYGHDLDAIDKEPWQLERAVKALNKSYKNSIGYAVSLELEALQPVATCIAAAKQKMRVVDGDGAGRAVFDFGQTTIPHSRRGPAPPRAVKKRRGHRVYSALSRKFRGSRPATNSFWAKDEHDLVEQVLKRIQRDDGDDIEVTTGGLATWCMDAKTLPSAIKIRGTLTLAEEVGKILRSGKPDPVGDVVTYLNRRRAEPRAFRLITGRLSRVATDDDDPILDVYSFAFRGRRGGEVMHVQKGVVAWTSRVEHPLSMYPDCSCYASVKGEPFSDVETPARLFGQQVSLVGVAAHPALLHRRILDRSKTSLWQSGYAGPYVPIAALQRRHQK